MTVARALVPVVVVVVVACAAAACGDTNAGRVCQPGDPAFCGDGLQCLTFCDKDTGPQSICTPSFGAEVHGTFDATGLIADRVSFGELGNVTTFAGDLAVEIKGVKGVALPLVEEVQGDLTIVGTDLECLSMPKLRRVGGLVKIDGNASLVRDELGKLANVGAARPAPIGEGEPSIIVTANALLPEVNWPSLADVAGGGIDVEDNDRLARIDFPQLAHVAGDVVLAGDRLERADLAALTGVDGCVHVAYADDTSCADATDGTVDPALGGACCASDHDYVLEVAGAACACP